MTKKIESFEDIEVDEVVGIDIEPEDRDVGIFGNWFCLVVKDNKGKQYQLGMNDDQFDKLMDLMEPYIKNRASNIQLEKECDK